MSSRSAIRPVVCGALGVDVNPVPVIVDSRGRAMLSVQRWEPRLHSSTNVGLL
jgi:hypothetical protein